MTLSVAVPRWFVDKIVNKNAGIRNPELRQIINEWLGISKLLALMPPIFWLVGDSKAVHYFISWVWFLTGSVSMVHHPIINTQKKI